MPVVSDPDVTVSSNMYRKRKKPRDVYAKTSFRVNLNLVQELDEVCGQRTPALCLFKETSQFSQIALLRAYFSGIENAAGLRKCGYSKFQLLQKKNKQKNKTKNAKTKSLCLHRHRDLGRLCFAEVRYTPDGMTLLRQLFCFVISANDLRETTMVGVFFWLQTSAVHT